MGRVGEDGWKGHQLWLQVPDGATVALVPCLTKHVLRENQDYVPGEREYPSSSSWFSCTCVAQSWGAGKVL